MTLAIDRSDATEYAGQPQLINRGKLAGLARRPAYHG
jgi:hypothetical protein